MSCPPPVLVGYFNQNTPYTVFLSEPTLPLQEVLASIGFTYNAREEYRFAVAPPMRCAYSPPLPPQQPVPRGACIVIFPLHVGQRPQPDLPEFKFPVDPQEAVIT